MSSTHSTTSTSSSTAAALNLFDFTEDELLHEDKLTHYEILNVPHHATPDQVKKAYRRTSLKYHPDKTGRGQEDYVFLAVKRAYDTLMDPPKRQAYDSTALPFDDSVPPPRDKLLADPMLLYKDDDFYHTFGPVFERNLRFDARLRPDLFTKTNKNRKSFSHHTTPPRLGHADTPMPEVHAFYEYWVHFESWRDFSAQAADELEMENDLDNAESRYEKRWIQQQVDKRAKQLKKLELNRIQTLVERAMEADPRVRNERLQEKRAKERAKQERLALLERQKEEQARQQLQEQAKEQALQEEKAREKAERELYKKQLRKARQQLRRMSSSPSFSRPQDDDDDDNIWKDSYDMEQDIELLCTTLSLTELIELNQQVEAATDGLESVKIIQSRVESVRERGDQGVSASGEDETKGSDSATNSDAAPSLETVTNNNSNNNNNNPWSSQELSALAKAVKKYPGTGANRWDAISSYINALCQQDIPRTKEECIEKYNQVARQAANSDGQTSARNNNNNHAASVTTTTTVASVDDWTTEQDQQLQAGLATFPASMDKNERWTQIAKGVSGKSKKDCVQRFKTIRDAIKSKK